MMALEALSPDERKRLVLSVGTHRVDRHLSPVEVALLFEKAINGGNSLADIAAAVQLDGTSWVNRFLSLLKLSPEVRHLVDWGRSGATLAFTAAVELARLGGAGDQQIAAQATLEHRLSSSEVRQLVQARIRSGKPMAECVRAVLKMRPVVETRHVFIGAVLEEDLKTLLKHMAQKERDALLTQVISKTYPLMKVSGRLGVDRFTLVGGPDLGAVIKVHKNKMEGEFNMQLTRMMAS